MAVNKTRISVGAVATIAVVLVLAVMYLWRSPAGAPLNTDATQRTERPTGAKAERAQPDAVEPDSKSNAPSTDQGSAPTGAVPQPAADKPKPPPESFSDRFSRLTAAGDWAQVAAFVKQSIEGCAKLSEFLPGLLACLESIEGKVGHDPLGRHIFYALLKRADLKECRALIEDAFLNKDSVLVTGTLVGLLPQVTDGSNDAALRTRIERLLIQRNTMAKQFPSRAENSMWTYLMFTVHAGFEKSIAGSIRFAESLRQTGLSEQDLDSFWDRQCVSGFHYKQYTPNDVPHLVQYLADYSSRTLAGAKDTAAAVERLKKIWVTLREDAAYQEALKLAASSGDKATREAFEAIAAHWQANGK